VEKEEKVRVLSMRERARERARERSWMGANAGTR